MLAAADAQITIADSLRAEAISLERNARQVAPWLFGEPKDPDVVI